MPERYPPRLASGCWKSSTRMLPQGAGRLQIAPSSNSMPPQSTVGKYLDIPVHRQQFFSGGGVFSRFLPLHGPSMRSVEIPKIGGICGFGGLYLNRETHGDPLAPQGVDSRSSCFMTHPLDPGSTRVAHLEHHVCARAGRRMEATRMATLFLFHKSKLAS